MISAAPPAPARRPPEQTGDPHARARADRRRRRARADKMFQAFCVFAASVAVATLIVLLGAIAWEGARHLDLSFLTDTPSRFPEKAGIGPAMWGTVWIILVCGAFALPLGVGTAVLLEEYRPKQAWARKLHSVVNLNITNLAGVPSIVYGIIGLTAFVEMWGVFGSTQSPAWELGTTSDWFYARLPLGRGVLAGGLTLMLVILPIIIVSAQEALRAVPDSLRESSLALGATRWQTVSRVCLPAALPGIMTGSILAISRAIGEAAPILVVCGIVFITFTPDHLMDSFTVMPLQIYNWASLPQAEFHRVAATGIIVLLSVLLFFNSIAILIRNRYQKPLS